MSVLVFKHFAVRAGASIHALVWGTDEWARATYSEADYALRALLNFEAWDGIAFFLTDRPEVLA